MNKTEIVLKKMDDSGPITIPDLFKKVSHETLQNKAQFAGFINYLKKEEFIENEGNSQLMVLTEKGESYIDVMEVERPEDKPKTKIIDVTEMGSQKPKFLEVPDTETPDTDIPEKDTLPEILAMDEISRIVEGIGESERRRVLAWVSDRYELAGA